MEARPKGRQPFAVAGFKIYRPFPCILCRVITERETEMAGGQFQGSHVPRHMDLVWG